jgi:hypothetical protein
MLEESRQSLGAPRRLLRPAGGHRSDDLEELSLDRGSHPAGRAPDGPLQPTDRPLEPCERGEAPSLGGPVVIERHDLTHGNHDEGPG